MREDVYEASTYTDLAMLIVVSCLLVMLVRHLAWVKTTFVLMSPSPECTWA